MAKDNKPLPPQTQIYQTLSSPFSSHNNCFMLDSPTLKKSFLDNQKGVSMLSKLFRSTTKIASSARFFSAVGEAAKKFHEENEAHLKALRKSGCKDPIDFAYLRSRSYLSDAAQKGQSDIDTPREPQSYLTKRELELYPTPLHYTFTKGTLPSADRFNWPVDKTAEDKEDSASEPGCSTTPKLS